VIGHLSASHGRSDSPPVCSFRVDLFLEPAQGAERHLAEDVEAERSDCRRADVERVVGKGPPVTECYERHDQQRSESKDVQ
jgi:hypothetical protein